MMSTNEEDIPEERVCTQCTRFHGNNPGTRCKRHELYVERMPTDEERAAAQKTEAEFAIKAAETVRTLRELLELSEDEDLIEFVKTLSEERTSAFNSIEEYIGKTAETATQAYDSIRDFVSNSIPREWHEEQLDLLGMTERDVMFLTDAERYSPVKLMVNRLRMLAPEMLAPALLKSGMPDKEPRTSMKLRCTYPSYTPIFGRTECERAAKSVNEAGEPRCGYHKRKP